MGNTLLPNNPTLDEIKDLIRRINSRIKIINASVNQEELTIDSPIATIIQSNSTDPGEYTTTDIDPTNFYTKNEINTLLQGKVNSADLDTTPTASSMNPVTSDGIKSYVDEKIPTDSEWQTWTNPSVFNGTVYYRKIGVFGIITFTGITLVNEATSGNIDLGTMPASLGMTPASLFTSSARIYTGGTSNYSSTFTIYATGSTPPATLLRVYKDPAIATIPTTAQLHTTIIYLLK